MKRNKMWDGCYTPVVQTSGPTRVKENETEDLEFKTRPVGFTAMIEEEDAEDPTI